MNLLDKNKFKITAFFRKIYFLDYANPTMAKISFNEEKLKQFIMNLDPNMKFIEYEEPNTMLVDELMIDELVGKIPQSLILR